MTNDFKQYHMKARFINYPYISNEEDAYSAMRNEVHFILLLATATL